MAFLYIAKQVVNKYEPQSMFDQNCHKLQSVFNQNSQTEIHVWSKM